MNNIYVIVGPSGVGKDTIANCILDKDESFVKTISVTTRKQRPGEVNGKHYVFMDSPQFHTLIETDSFIEHCEVHGNFYGTLKSGIDEILRDGNKPLMILDVQGYEKIKTIYGDTVKGIFIDPPSLVELEHRLRERGTDTEESIKRRLINAKLEIEYSKKQDYAMRVINNTLEQCVNEVYEFIKPRKSIIFEISESQEKDAMKWFNNHHCEFKRLSYIANKNATSTQAAYSYQFTTGSIGYIAKVVCKCGKSHNITDYDMW